jgi:chemotaxis family two-component system response regulator Rcp1
MPTRKTVRSKSSEILLVEDNPGDIRLVQEAFKEGRLESHLSVTRDGEEALAFLHRQTPYEESPRPELILLDLNLPRKDGREVLAEIKRTPKLRQIPVIVLSTSTSDDDRRTAENLRAKLLYPKPAELYKMVHLLMTIEDFWLSKAVLPTHR